MSVSYVAVGYQEDGSATKFAVLVSDIGPKGREVMFSLAMDGTITGTKKQRARAAQVIMGSLANKRIVPE